MLYSLRMKQIEEKSVVVNEPTKDGAWLAVRKAPKYGGGWRATASRVTELWQSPGKLNGAIYGEVEIEDVDLALVGENVIRVVLI